MDDSERRLLQLAVPGPVLLWQAIEATLAGPRSTNMWDARDTVYLRLERWFGLGWVELYRGRGDDPRGPLARVPTVERQRVLLHEPYWSAPQGDEESVWFAATRDGAAAARE